MILSLASLRIVGALIDHCITVFLTSRFDEAALGHNDSNCEATPLDLISGSSTSTDFTNTDITAGVSNG